MRIGAVINNTSGTLSPEESEKRLENIRLFLEKRVDADYLAIVPGNRVKSEIERIIDKGIDVLVAGGGDGTISTAAQFVISTDTLLLPLALGTMNNFVRDAGIPLHPIDALRLLDQINVEVIDTGEVNGHKFINNVSIGLYPKIVEEREEKTKKHGWSKWKAKILAVLVVTRKLPLLRMTVEGKHFKKKLFTPFLFVGNNEYENLLKSDFYRPSLKKGKLWICMARSPRIWSLFIMAWQLGIRGIRGTENLETHLLTHVRVKPRKRRVRVAIDGEIHKLYAPLRFKILKKSLRLVVP